MNFESIETDKLLDDKSIVVSTKYKSCKLKKNFLSFGRNEEVLAYYDDKENYYDIVEINEDQNCELSETQKALVFLYMKNKQARPDIDFISKPKVLFSIKDCFIDYE